MYIDFVAQSAMLEPTNMLTKLTYYFVVPTPKSALADGCLLTFIHCYNRYLQADLLELLTHFDGIYDIIVARLTPSQSFVLTS